MALTSTQGGAPVGHRQRREVKLLKQVSVLPDIEKSRSQVQRRQQYSSRGTTALSWQWGIPPCLGFSPTTISASHIVTFYCTIHIEDNNIGVFCFGLRKSPRKTHIHAAHIHIFLLGLFFKI